MVQTSVAPGPPPEPEELVVPELDPFPDPLDPLPDPLPPDAEPELPPPELVAPDPDDPPLEVDEPPLDDPPPDVEPRPPEPDDDVVASAPEEPAPPPPPDALDPPFPSVVVELHAETIIPAPVDVNATHARSHASFMVYASSRSWFTVVSSFVSCEDEPTRDPVAYGEHSIASPSSEM